MRKHSMRLIFGLIIMALANIAFPIGASGQSNSYPPYELYRFHIGGTSGYSYIPWYSIGINAGYSFKGWVGSGLGRSAGVYPRVDNGSAPLPSTGLIPLYQWTVFQGARSYNYFSLYNLPHGSGYTFNGVMGYVYPVSGTPIPGFPGLKMSQWYSSTRGFWYGMNEPGDPDFFEQPPVGEGYGFQGVVCRLPYPSRATAPNRCSDLQNNPPLLIHCFANESFVPYGAPPPPPATSCDPNDEQWCNNSGGWWDSGVCNCNWDPQY